MRHQLAFNLFDLKSTYSYVSFFNAPPLDLYWDSVSVPLCVSTPMGKSFIMDWVFRSSVVIVQEFYTHVDIIILYMVDIDVIL